MKNRDKLKELATKTGNSEHLERYKLLRNQVKKKLPLDKKKYYSDIFHDQERSISGIWSTAYQMLGQTKNLAPVQLIQNGNAIVSPRGMANAFNSIFIKKVQDLRNGIIGPTIEDPLNRLKDG